MSASSKKDKKSMATVPVRRPSRSEVHLEEYRRMRSKTSHATHGTVEQRNEESERVLESLRQERIAANALIADER